jgi:hypothetical protein
MVILYCIDRIYGNAYLITFKVDPVSAHICCIDPALVGSTGGRFSVVIFQSSAVAFDLMFSYGYETRPLDDHKKPLGTISGLYSG